MLSMPMNSMRSSSSSTLVHIRCARSLARWCYDVDAMSVSLLCATAKKPTSQQLSEARNLTPRELHVCQFVEKLALPTLTEILRLNHLRIDGTKPYLIERVFDGMARLPPPPPQPPLAATLAATLTAVLLAQHSTLMVSFVWQIHGGIPPCPLCNTGKLALSPGSLVRCTLAHLPHRSLAHTRAHMHAAGWTCSGTFDVDRRVTTRCKFTAPPEAIERTFWRMPAELATECNAL